VDRSSALHSSRLLGDGVNERGVPRIFYYYYYLTSKRSILVLYLGKRNLMEENCVNLLS